jgi:hypothetical protein
MYYHHLFPSKALNPVHHIIDSGDYNVWTLSWQLEFGWLSWSRLDDRVSHPSGILKNWPGGHSDFISFTGQLHICSYRFYILLRHVIQLRVKVSGGWLACSQVVQHLQKASLKVTALVILQPSRYSKVAEIDRHQWLLLIGDCIGIWPLCEIVHGYHKVIVSVSLVARKEGSYHVSHYFLEWSLDVLMYQAPNKLRSFRPEGL